MKTRSYKVLLTILLTKLETNGMGRAWGLCAFASSLFYVNIFNYTEMVKIKNYILDHRPKRGVYFDKTKASTEFFWELTIIPPRIAWLKYRIKKH